MNKWMVRGLVFAAGMVVLRLVQGALINAWQTQSALISIVLLTIFIICAAVWGTFDGRADAKTNPDPDRREDLAMVWLLAGLVAGLISGAVAWIIALFYKAIYTGGLLNELTTFAAFTALLVFLFAIVGVSLGRWRVDRTAPPVEKHDGSRGGPDRADTDVFSAVRADDSPTGEIPTAVATEERTSPVATMEREQDSRTEVIPTHDSDAKTEIIRTHEDDPKTEVIRTDDPEAKTEIIRTDADHTKPDPRKD
ncbi:B-4DMT family transporter [Mycobacterium vicinigordonae]|uniref:B-4DMT family transporter n=1 Tax=Mycobacterium vicinigordonae TaxID=1719132 RepID=A0A7D6E0V4_9MYCO|nr:B-4DMT family transporter [Mycobacterium vicinigordonae]QLL09487.1 B-4DMT family transporter [Mycobacterium vicinigordonae]